MKEQNYEIDESIVYQDNVSAIRMERNGRGSSTHNSRHIDIRYFFTKDRVNKKEIDIQYCPTQKMLADFFTKPLQGELFRKFRKVIMGWEPLSYLNENHTTIPNTPQTETHNMESKLNKERVEKNSVFNYKSMMNKKGEKLTYAEVLKKKNNK